MRLYGHLEWRVNALEQGPYNGAEITGPVNIMVNPGCPSTAELTLLGVARVSLGAGPMRATLSLVRRIATELAAHGTYNGFLESMLSRAECNRLFEKA